MRVVGECQAIEEGQIVWEQLRGKRANLDSGGHQDLSSSDSETLADLDDHASWIFGDIDDRYPFWFL